MNIFSRFLALLPQTPLYVGIVRQVSGGVALIEMPGGAFAQARGDVAVNDYVFFRDGAVEGPAPVLPEEEYDV